MESANTMYGPMALVTIVRESGRSLLGAGKGRLAADSFLGLSRAEASMIAALMTPQGWYITTFCFNGVAEDWRTHAVKIAGKHRDERQRGPRCSDCGELGERIGHMGCQYPQDHP